MNGGLDLAAEEVFGGRTVWHAEIDPAASKILATRWPGTPNLGDITKVDWTRVEPVDVLCGGFPCTDVSAAGRRAGMNGTRSGLWSEMANAINILRPKFVVIENVRGLLSTWADGSDGGDSVEFGAAGVGDGAGRPVLRAGGAVLGTLADIGFDAWWTTVAASDVGAPHRRERVFILATPADAAGVRPGEQHLSFVGGVPATVGGSGAGTADEVALLPTPRSSDQFGAGAHGDGGMDLRTTVVEDKHRWGKYAAAIHRWEQVLGVPAPSPTEPNSNGKPRLSAAFAEFMMGLPAGWVTGVDISRNNQLKAIGNGVCPQQAAYALRQLLAVAAGYTPQRVTTTAPELLPTPCARDYKDGEFPASHARNTPSIAAISYYFPSGEGA